MRGEFADGQREGVVDMGSLTYRPHGAQGIAEVAPTHCPAGHPLTAGKVLVGGDTTRRTYTCRVCEDAGVSPHTMRYTTGL